MGWWHSYFAVAQELVTESLSQIRLFSAEPRMIKKRIESLIERQYIKRQDGNRGTYDYLA